MVQVSTFKARHHITAEQILAGVDHRVDRWHRRRRLSRWMDQWGYPLLGMLLMAASTGVMVWGASWIGHYLVQSWR